MADVEHKQKSKSSKKPIKNIITKPKNNLPKEELIEKFSLQEVLTLGGDKDDFERLMNIDENDDNIVDDNTVDIGNLQNEIGSLIKELGFEKIIKEESNQQNDTNETNNNNLDKTLEKESSKESTKKKDKKKMENDKESKEEDETVSIKEEEINFDIEEILKKYPLVAYDKILLKDCVPWHDQVSKIPKQQSKLPGDQINSISNRIEDYWNKEVELYQKVKDKDTSSDAQWLSTVLKSGTLSDKTAALTMLTQESPIHCMRSLDALMSLAKKKARREALIAVDSLRHLWISDLLPPVKLRKFQQFPVENITSYAEGSKSELKMLIVMFYEDKLKSVYQEFLEIIKTLSKDPLVNIRTKILGIIFELLIMKPEQEQTLLGMLINKLGDPEKAVASKASYLLLQLVMKHPNMKNIVITEVERMMFRPNVGLKAQYYACCFLNQIPLSHEIKTLASKLVSLYFSFFKILVNKQGQSTDIQITKLLSALLTGVNRAFPYTEGAEETYEEQLNTLFKLAHSKHLGTSIQAFMLIYHVMESKQTVSDRFYQALYEKLVDPELKTSSKQAMLLNLIFKAVRDDPILKRIKTFVKRLLQVSSQSQPSFLCGILFLLSEVVKKKQGIKSMFNQPEDDDEDEEHFKDVILEAEEEEAGDETKEKDDEKDVIEDSKEEKTGPSWTFRATNKDTTHYNIHARNPLYAGAEYTCAWELTSISNHFHPSAQHFADSLLKGEDIVYKGDPLDDFTLLRFLDRFMYRNPKKHDVEHGHSLMQRQKHSARLKEQPVNSTQFLQHSEDNVRQDELFFLRYFKMKDEESSNKKKVKEEDEDEEDDEDIDQFGDIDFASEMKKNKGKKPTTEEEEGEENEDGDDESESGDEFNYDDMMEEESDFDDSDLENGGGKKNFTDKDYEDALFSQLNSDGESIDGEDGDGGDLDEEERMNEMLLGDAAADDDGDEEGSGFAGGKSRSKKRKRDEPMFASAEEFAHLLEKGEENTGDYAESVHPKQRKWEEKQQTKRSWNNKKPRGGHAGGGRGGHKGGNDRGPRKPFGNKNRRGGKAKR
eukprot:TCONS_00067631-protein